MSFSLFNGNKNSDDQQEKKGRRFPTQTVLVIRAIVGAYLIYTAYQLYTDKSGGIQNWVMCFFTVFFAVVGAGLIVYSGLLYYKGEYEGGKADVEEEEPKKSEPAEAVEPSEPEIEEVEAVEPSEPEVEEVEETR